MWAYLGYILGISWACLGRIFGVSWVYHGHFVGINWAYLGHIRYTSWTYLGHLIKQIKRGGGDYNVCLSFLYLSWFFLVILWYLFSFLLFSSSFISWFVAFSLNRPHWAYSVIDLPCPSVVVCLVLRH